MDIQTLKTKFENGTYKLRNVPPLLDLDNVAVHVHKDGLNQDLIESQKSMNWSRDKVIAPKLIGSSYGEYYLHIQLIRTEYFESKERLDSLYEKECWRGVDPEDSDPPLKREKASLEEALELLTVTISCNIKYYLANRGEMEKDLGRKLDSLDLNDKNVLTQLEGELLYNQLISIFGESDDDIGGAIILTDFHILYSDGNYKFATAKRGNYYWIFYYETS